MGWRAVKDWGRWPCCLVLAGALWGCNRPGCDGIGRTDADSPQITRFTRVGTYPDDPWTLVLAIEFSQAAATLKDGSALLYLGASQEPLRLPLRQPFAQIEQPDGATSGRLGLLFPFNSGVVQDGDQLRLGVQLEDGAKPHPDGKRSNCYSLDLSFEVSPATRLQAVGRRLWQLASRAGGWGR